MPFEHWTDLAELEALCRLIGPYGVKQIEQRLLSLIGARLKAIRESLAANAGPLQALAKNFYHAPAVADAVKRMSGLDQAANELVALGCLQQLRALLREALVSARRES